MSEIVIVFSLPPRRRVQSLERLLQDERLIFFKSISVINGNKVLPLKFEIRANQSSEYVIDPIQDQLEVINGSDKFSYLDLGNVGVDCGKVSLEIEFVPKEETLSVKGRWVKLIYERVDNGGSYDYYRLPEIRRKRKIESSNHVYT
jgi:hypothetical protein